MNQKEKAVASGFSGSLLLFWEPLALLCICVFPLKKLMGETVDVFVYVCSLLLMAFELSAEVESLIFFYYSSLYFQIIQMHK
jgi:hypothetical protein